ncbi:glycerophosphodiester phosphodiesterase family protein [Arcanobacterium hippocoleae]|uniref:Glycerophosphoryl diester phosphodiesterase n=1 Tax=Arcanobacterium hippocoleae TaxID=149017 RepID=A0ABU1T1F5_9ACTO|nr:glycerophosphodiester phosphodiesterase family protein [Arcanobacterium hippocoleae]MDR6939177.1 glycerophosphoryl diester phosphodiesterase [Arcanobacterium hippocoleae]
MKHQILNREIIAHRGLNTLAPENTLSAIRMTADQGGKWFETDVDILGDGTPVIIHDTLLDRTTNKSGYFYDLSIEDLPKIDAGAWFSREYAGEPMPTLRQLVELMNETGLNANIELKSNERGKDTSLQLIENTLAELERLDPEREIIISSFNHLLLHHVHERRPDIPIGALFVKENLWPDWRSILELVGASYIHPENTGLTQQMVQTFRAAGYGVNVWTVNSKARANELFNWGATGVFTDIAHEF